MFEQVLGKLDSWVGRSFLLASFFPLLIFVAANFIMAQVFAPDTTKELIRYFSDNFYGPVSVAVACLIAIAALAYVTDPLVGTMTRFLEGAYFPSCVTRWLATDQTRRVRDLQEEEQRSGGYRAALHFGRKTMLAELLAARDLGVAIGAMREPSLIKQAKTEIDRLDEMQDQQLPILLHHLESTVVPLKKALTSNCANPSRLVKGGTQDDEEQSRTLSSIYSSMLRLIDYAQGRQSTRTR